MTEAQKNIAWAVSRIQEEIAKAKAGAKRAAKRAANSVMLPDKQRPAAKRGEVAGLRKALRLVRQVQKAVG